LSCLSEDHEKKVRRWALVKERELFRALEEERHFTVRERALGFFVREGS